MGRLSSFMWRSPFFPRKLSFTAEGKAVFLISVGLGFAAVNTGNNLIYLVFGLSLSLILISGVLSEWNLRRVVAEMARIPKTHAQSDSPCLITLRKVRGRFPSYCVSAWPFFDSEHVRSRPATLVELKPGQEVSVPAYVTFDRRGEYRLMGLAISTNFPFSFFTKAVVVQREARVLVWPRVDLVKARDLTPSSPGDEHDADRPGKGLEFFGARDFRPGDSPKHILHRKSAGRPQPVVKETEATARSGLWIVLVNAIPSEATSADAVEQAIADAASLVALEAGRGTTVALSALGGFVPPGTGVAQMESILDFLALLPVYRVSHGDPLAGIRPAEAGFRTIVVAPA